MAKVGAAVLLWLAHVQAAAAGSIKVADLENGAEVSTCIKIEDYNTKKMDEEMETAEREADSGCCPSGFTPGVKHYNQYLSAMIVCGFKDDGTVSVTTGTKCTYNKCFVMKADMTCKDDSKMTVNGCCPSGQAPDDCTMGSSSSNALKYCTRYKTADWKLEYTAEKSDDIKDGKLQLDKLQVYTECPGVSGSGGGQSSDGKASDAAATKALTAIIVAVMVSLS